MDKQEYLEKIAFNVIQGRVEAEDEGLDEGLEGQPAVTELVEEAIEANIDARDIVVKALTIPMEQVGASAECVGAAMDILSPHLMKGGMEPKGKFVIATVADDLHDIGKNIVSILLKGAGYEVIDLGNNVSTQTIVDEVKNNGAQYLGLSALLTTTMRGMGDVVVALKEASVRDQVKVLIGGAPTSAKFAEEIGADKHCKDAFQAIDYLKELHA